MRDTAWAIVNMSDPMIVIAINCYKKNNCRLLLSKICNIVFESMK